MFYKVLTWYRDEQYRVEKETTQTEILHMESRETGEFAHRETTDYEQLETFNAEVNFYS